MSILKTLKPEALVTLTALTIAGLASLAATAAPAKRTAHGAGNGGDRLELASGEGSGDVEISVPDDLGRSGTLEVVGTPGAGQKDEVQIYSCESDSQGTPVRFGCKVFKSIHLNEPTVLIPGTYWISYSNTDANVRVRADEKTVATLKKLKVTQTYRSVSFSVFQDLTDSSMQDDLLLRVFTFSANRPQVERYCRIPDLSNKAVCDSFASGNYHALLNKGAQFNSDGSWNSWVFSHGSPNSGSFDNKGRLYVTDPKAGEFVSVFPGVYGVVFTDNQTGKTETRYGIHVN
jgi:hypothetical protein